jgi:hypothetical protein
MRRLARAASGKLKRSSSSQKGGRGVDASLVTLERAGAPHAGASTTITSHAATIIADLQKQLAASEQRLREANEKGSAQRKHLDELKEQRARLQAENTSLREENRLLRVEATAAGGAQATSAAQLQALVRSLEAQLSEARAAGARQADKGAAAPSAAPPAAPTRPPPPPSVGPAGASSDLAAGLSAVGLTPEVLALALSGVACTFWFVRAAPIRDDDDPDARFLTMQVWPSWPSPPSLCLRPLSCPRTSPVSSLDPHQAPPSTLHPSPPPPSTLARSTAPATPSGSCSSR